MLKGHAIMDLATSTVDLRGLKISELDEFASLR